MKPIMIFPFGAWDTKKYGKLPLTEALADKLIENFDSKVLGEREPFIDQDHDRGKSAGWFKNLFKKDGALYGVPEWTALGKQLLKDKIYRYFSVTIEPHKDPTTGKEYAPVFKGGALTNSPVMTMMPAIELSEDGRYSFTFAHDLSTSNKDDANSHNDDKSKEKEKKMDEKELRKLLNLSDTDDIGEAVKGLTDKAGQVDSLETNVTKLSDKLKKAEQSVEELKDKGDEKGKITLSEKELVSLKADAAAGQEAKKALYEMRKSTAIKVALSEGKLNPADKEVFEGHFDNMAKAVSIEAAESLLVDLPAKTDLSESGSGEGSTESVELSEADKEIAKMMGVPEEKLKEEVAS